MAKSQKSVDAGASGGARALGASTGAEAGSEPAPTPQPPRVTQRCAVMLDAGNGLFHVAHVDLHSDGTYTLVWQNFEQMIHMAIAEMAMQQRLLLSTQSTRFHDGERYQSRGPE